MEILKPYEHRRLAYIEAVQLQGYTLNVREFHNFSVSPSRRPGRTSWTATRKLTASIAQAFSRMPVEVIEEPESVLDYFRRVGWVDTPPAASRTPGSPVRITDLGVAVLRHTEAADTEGVSEMTVVLDPSDPFSYARVIGRIAALGEAMLVDPYFGLDQLSHIAFRTEISRVLTSYGKESELAGLATALDTIDLDRDFDLRVVDRHEIHDRFVIAGESVHFIGTSLSGIGKRPSVMGQLHGSTARAVASLHEQIWESADRLFEEEEDTEEDSPQPETN